jgi:hypothetical protein
MLTLFAVGIDIDVGTDSFKTPLGSKDDSEVRALNEKYEKFREFQSRMNMDLSQQAKNLTILNEMVASNTEDIQVWKPNWISISP